jgi:hypothetical protein
MKASFIIPSVNQAESSNTCCKVRPISRAPKLSILDSTTVALLTQKLIAVIIRLTGKIFPSTNCIWLATSG